MQAGGSVADRGDDNTDNESPDRPARSGPEGVRILGAEEAQAAMEGGQVGRRRPDDEPRYGDVPPRPDPEVRPTVRFPLPESGLFGPSDTPSWSASEEGVAPVADEPSGPVPLPHWSDPPTGEVPQILPEAEPVDITSEEDLDAWASLSGSTPRFRAGAADWDEGDFQVESLSDDEPKLGALADKPPDDDEAFESEVTARRRRIRGRTVSSAAPSTAAAGTNATPPANGPRPTGVRGAAPRRVGLEPEEPTPPMALAPGEGAPFSTRFATGLAVAAVAVVCLILGSAATAALAAIVVGFSCIEILDAIRKHGYRPAAAVALLGSIAMVIVAYNDGLQAFPLIAMLVVVFSMLWYLFEVVRARATVNVAMTLLPFGYAGMLGGFAGLLLNPDLFPDGVGLILGMAICAVGYDVFGYVIGSQFGKTRIAPRVSPNKTLEGLLGGMFASLLLGVIVSAVFGLTPWDGKASYGLALGAVVAVVAPLGDLCESLLKRDLGIKDLGSVLPGHGGFLDRFDAILFCLPATYYLALALKIA